VCGSFMAFLTLLDFYEESVMRFMDSPIYIVLFLVFAFLYFGFHVLAYFF
jgi:hypothetical protein